MRRIIPFWLRLSGAPKSGRRPRFLWRIGAAVALMMGLLMPWPGPHIDRYVSLAEVAINARGQDVEPAFWLFWGVLWITCSALWLGCLMLAWALLNRRKR